MVDIKKKTIDNTCWRVYREKVYDKVMHFWCVTLWSRFRLKSLFWKHLFRTTLFMLLWMCLKKYRDENFVPVAITGLVC